MPRRPVFALPRGSTGTAWVYLVGGASYPLWRGLAPSEALDPAWLWWAVGGCFAACGALWLLRRDATPRSLLMLPPGLVALHVHGLLAANPTLPFYSLAAAMAVVTTVLVLQATRQLVAYSLLVFALAGLLFALGGGSGPLIYWVSLAWVLALTYRRVLRQRMERELADSLQRGLEERLAQETSKRRQLEEELHLAQHMESIGRLAGALAHEFNNQLMAIRIYAELMEREAPSALCADLEKIKAATDQAADLTGQLVRFSRPRARRDEAVDLNAVVQERLPMLRHLMGEGVTTHCPPAAEPCWVPVARERVEQVLVNLALNARDAMPDGGSFTVTLGRQRRDEVELPAHLADLEAEELVVLAVSDTGVGMDAATRARVFDPFFTTKRDRGRTGLGLFIVYGVANESGGHVRVASEPGRGTRFEIYWPAMPAVATARPAASQRESARPGHARVLLVEDQPDVRAGLLRWLRDAGYSVLEAETGEQALELADVPGAPLDVVATDVVLPGMDGIELIARLRERNLGLKAVAFSGHLDHWSRTGRVIPEGVPLLEKPFDPRRLIDEIARLCGGGDAGPSGGPGPPAPAPRGQAPDARGAAGAPRGEREARTPGRSLLESAGLATAFHASPVAMALTDLSGDELIDANASYWELVGLPEPSPDRNARLVEFFRADDRRAPSLARVREKGAFRGRGTFRQPSGALREMLITAHRLPLDGRHVVIWQAVDLTELHLAQRALQEKDLRYRSLVESCPLAITTVDREHRVTMVNAARLRLLGAEGEEQLLGADARTLAGAAWPSIEADIARVMQRGERCGIEMSYVTPWGHPVHERAHLAPLYDADGAVIGSIAVSEDLSGWRRIEEQLRQSQKMEALGQLAAGAAHDFKNWLMVMDGWGREVEQGLAAGHPLRAAARQIRRAAAEAMTLAQRLLTFGRAERLVAQVLEPNELLASAEGMLRHTLPPNVELTLALGSSVPHVRADPAALEQAVLNLVLNARDAMPGGGRLSIATSALDARDGLRADGVDLPPGRWLRISVQDSGVGIPSGTRERIFEPFFTTKQESSGLGLAMVYGIVSESGGQVGVWSRPGRGARFDVYLPGVEEDAALRALAPRV
jgi:PAS domain S-box-containing protein